MLLVYNDSHMNRNTVIKTVAKNLRKVRLAKHMTQAEVANGAGIAPNHYAKIERCEAIPSVVTLAALIKSLKTKSSKILNF